MCGGGAPDPRVWRASRGVVHRRGAEEVDHVRERKRPGRLMAKINPVSQARIRIPVPLILLVVAGVAVWFFFIREKPAEPVDPHADIQVTPIDGPLDAFRLAWGASDVDDIVKFELRDEGEEAVFLSKAEPLGWLDSGLPKIISHKAERAQKVRYTISWVLTGHEQPMVTFWEWTDLGWRIATWKLPRE